jgi:hypothetical protein
MSFTSVLPRLLSVSGRLKAKKRTAITRISSYSTDLTSITRAWSNQKRNNRRKFSAAESSRALPPSLLFPLLTLSLLPSLPPRLQRPENLFRIFFLLRFRFPNVHIRLSSATEIEKMSLLHCCNAGWPRANGGSGAQATRARSPSHRSPGYLSDGCRGD